MGGKLQYFRHILTLLIKTYNEFILGPVFDVVVIRHTRERQLTKLNVFFFRYTLEQRDT